jgi:O-antigen/teichoic acid export membrane protein
MDRAASNGWHLRTVARGWALNLFGAVCFGALNFLLVVVVTRGLGAGRAGGFFEAVALFSILSHSASLGADTGVVRMVSRQRALDRDVDVRRTLSVAVWPAVVAGAGAGAIVFVGAPWIADLVADPSHQATLATYLRVMAPFLPIAAGYTVVIAATRGFGTMVPATVVDRVAKPALQPALLAVVVGAGLGGIAIALSWTAPLIVVALAASLWLVRLVRKTERDAHLHQPARSFRQLSSEFWRFTAPRGLAAVFQVTILWLDTLMIGALASTRDAGIYTAATRYVVIGMFAAIAIMQVLAPKLSELLAKQEHEGAEQIYQTATAWLIGLNWPIYLTLIVFAPFLLSLFGPGFVEGDVALLVLAGTMMVATAVGPVDVVLLMGGKSLWHLLNTLVALALNIGLNLILIPRMGIVGAAVAWSASILFNNLAPVIQVWLLLRLHPFGPAFWRVTGSAALCFGLLALLVRGLMGPSLAGFVTSTLVAIALYVALLWRSRRELRLWVIRDAFRPRSKAVAAERVVSGV